MLERQIRQNSNTNNKIKGSKRRRIRIKIDLHTLELEAHKYIKASISFFAKLPKTTRINIYPDKISSSTRTYQNNDANFIKNFNNTS